MALHAALLVFIPLLYLSVFGQPFEGKNSVTSLQKYIDHAPPRNTILRSDELQLLDTVLLATVDGRFHALNRTTGRLIWTMELPLANPQVSISNLRDMVQSEHGGLHRGGDHVLDPDEDSFSETYIIEPQTGHIFVHPADATRDEPLQRLPFTMAQLVDMSPFSYDGRTFVGKKRTSLITLDLGSGEVLEILDPEQCSWGDSPLGRKKKNVLTEEEELLDELDPPGAERIPLHIGRTDYQVSVFSEKQATQNLTFSAYGPNNIDKDLQALWRRTPDSRYHQSTPDGTLLMFKTDERVPFHSFLTLKQPVVAVFDTVSLSDRSTPLALLQPAPELSDLYPGRRDDLRELRKNQDFTYVGRIGDSLFALSQATYQHVIFSHYPSVPTIQSEKDREFHEVLDTDEAGVPLQEVCTSLDCLVGVHRSAMASSSTLSRLISSPRPTKEADPVPSPLGYLEDKPIVESVTTSSPPVVANVPPPSSQPYPMLDPPNGGFASRIVSRDLKNPILTAMVGLLIFAWIFARKVGQYWRSQQAESFVVRDLGQEAVSFPVRKVSFDSPASPVSPTDVTKPLPPVPVEAVEVDQVNDNVEGDGETEKEGATTDAESNKGGKKRKGTRRTRGNGGKPKKKVTIVENPTEEKDPSSLDAPESNIVLRQRSLSSENVSSLTVTDTVLGYGSHGTVVFQGEFQGRAVAVKRLLQDFTTLASREVSILQESDDHPNVIRYYFKESRDNFLYIALELCPASLADIIERPDAFPEINATFDAKRALAQVTNGLKHLHSLKIIHRDIKPQNILLSKPGPSRSNAGRSITAAPYRMLISDFGLCRKLESDQTSFLPTVHSGGGAAAGTVGWRAPEILKGDVKLDDATLDQSSGGTPNSSLGGTGGSSSGNSARTGVTRLTKSVDIFALGCLYFYTLAQGDHPYGERFEREVNIVKNVKDLDRLNALGEEGKEAQDLIQQMLDPDPKRRPDTTSCLTHPFFWGPARRLGFLQDASDRFEIMQREPREPQLEKLETNAEEVVTRDWHKRLDKVFDDNLGKFRKYDGKSVQDLLRALRNKKHHYQDLPDNVKRSLGTMPEGFLSYFTERFPNLFLHVHSVIATDPLLRQEDMFRSYFELSHPD